MSGDGVTSEKQASETRGKPQGPNRRKQERFECDGFAEVIVSDAAFLFRGAIQDFSLTGCYIQSRARLSLERGAEVDLRFSLKGDFFNTRARIMIIRPGAGAGFEFLPDDPRVQGRLEQLIEKLTGASLGREEIADQNLGNGEKLGGSRNLWPG